MRPSVGSQARPESPSGGAVNPRQEVSERIGLGRSSCQRLPPGRPRREAPAAKATCPWPVKPRLALAALSPCRAGAQASVRQERSGSQDPGRLSVLAPRVERRSGSHPRASSRRKPRPQQTRFGGSAGHEAEASIPGARQRLTETQAGFRAQAGGRVEPPVLEGESPRDGWSAKAHARECSASWGSVDLVVVLAGCLDCRSRRAALGPPPSRARGSSPSALPPGRLAG